MRAERACANPLCEHFWRMVPARIDVFAYLLDTPTPVPLGREYIAIPEAMEILTKRIGRKLYRWIALGDDMFTTPSWCCEATMYWNMEKNRDEKDERYYFCSDCDEVLQAAKPLNHLRKKR